MHEGYWRPRYRQTSLKKPLRPVVLRPHLSAGLPLNSAHTMRWVERFCKALFQVTPFGDSFYETLLGGAL
jgi:hypothetical protein